MHPEHFVTFFKVVVRDIQVYLGKQCRFRIILVNFNFCRIDSAERGQHSLARIVPDNLVEISFRNRIVQFKAILEGHSRFCSLVQVNRDLHVLVVFQEKA